LRLSRFASEPDTKSGVNDAEVSAAAGVALSRQREWNKLGRGILKLRYGASLQGNVNYLISKGDVDLEFGDALGVATRKTIPEGSHQLRACFVSDCFVINQVQ